MKKITLSIIIVFIISAVLSSCMVLDELFDGLTETAQAQIQAEQDKGGPPL